MQEKKYLVVIQVNVAGEGDVGLIKVLTEKELDDAKSISNGFGNIDGEACSFNEADVSEITEDELAVLKKFGLTDLQFGYCCISNEELDEE